MPREDDSLSFVAVVGAAAMKMTMGHPEDFRPAASEVQERVIDDLLHDKERSGLANAGQCDQLVTMNAIEICDIPYPDLQKVVEIPAHETAVTDEIQFRDGSIACCATDPRRRS